MTADPRWFCSHCAIAWHAPKPSACPSCRKKAFVHDSAKDCALVYPDAPRSKESARYRRMEVEATKNLLRGYKEQP